MLRSSALVLLAMLTVTACSKTPAPPPAPYETKKHAVGELLTGLDARGDFTTDEPGIRRKLTTSDLPPPNHAESVDNGPKIVSRPDGAMPRVPAGFDVTVFAEGLEEPRMIRTAPNGDVYVAESAKDRVRIFPGGQPTPKPGFFAEGLDKPFGIAFHDSWVYVANTGSVVRIPVGGGKPEMIVPDISSGGHLRGGGHWTRDIVFSRDGKKMYVSVGSRSNVDDGEAEAKRARILEFDPDGKDERVYATGIRNPVGLAVHPDTGELWTSVNERDELGDHLVPDYITHVRDGGFYGWPWFYIGAHPDPRMDGKHPELAAQVVVPDVLLQSHSASLGMTFYTGNKFPAEYRGNAFAAEHGSWNRTRRTGYKVIRVPMIGGKATGEYVDFMTGFVTPAGEVWGRPVAVTQTTDGALLVTDDAGGRIWKIARKP